MSSHDFFFPKNSPVMVAGVGIGVYINGMTHQKRKNETNIPKSWLYKLPVEDKNTDKYLTGCGMIYKDGICYFNDEDLKRLEILEELV